jgi:hypothetical protein
MDEFAADLNGVRTGEAPSIYRDPNLLFARTYPTYRMKMLVRDVMTRLAGQGGKPVLRLQVAYGGGKTHTLITLLHLAEKGANHAHNNTVKEFSNFAGLSQLPEARVAILPCDKFDIKNGLEVFGPNGKTRRVNTLWGALAYQLAGDAGYLHLQAHDNDFIAPAEPLLVDLLQVPLKEGLGALILIDEAVWYYRGVVNQNQRRLGTIKDFYQVLTQAVAKVSRAAMTASLIASRLEANDQTGTECLKALEEVFGRIAEPIEPVRREDVAEVLRRRLFESVPGPAERRPAVDAMLNAMQRLPLPEGRVDQTTDERLLDSYPFHPDLIEVLYQKWTQMDKFQRTRGALRLLAYALRESEALDNAPFIGPKALLLYNGQNGKSSLSAALDELVGICEESHKWTSSLTGEMAKAREIQTDLPTLKSREIEQAVVITFLHSQPFGQKAVSADLLPLLAHPEIDVAAMEEGLRKWRERSWFLVENPDVWQLGTTPNLTHMHIQAMGRLNESEIDDELERRIRSVLLLQKVDDGVELHLLPETPRDVEDNLRLHYLILEPAYAVTPGQPLPAKVEAYFNEKAGPRIYRNNILALAPEAASVAGLREQVRRWLGWGRLERPEMSKLLTDYQRKVLPQKMAEATNNLPEAVIGAYRILVAVSEEGVVEAKTLRASSIVGGTPFERIKNLLIEEERLVADILDPDLILPGSYFKLWAENQTSHRVSALMEAFGQFPRLPRLLRPESLYETLKRGIRQGAMMLRLLRPDGSAQTWWLVPPDDEMLRRSEMEVQPAGQAELYNLSPELLKPGQINGLWPTGGNSLTLERARGFFEGVNMPRLVEPDVLDKAIRQAVQRGMLMVRMNEYSFYQEELPDGRLPDSLELLLPPPRISGGHLTPQALPEVWQDGQAILADIAASLATKQGYTIPWAILNEAVNEALSLGFFEVAGGPWPCSPVAANEVIFRPVEKITLSAETVLKAIEYTGSSTPTLSKIKEAIKNQFFSGREIPNELFIEKAKEAIERGFLSPVDEWRGTASEGIRVRRPDIVLFGETELDLLGLQRLAEQVSELIVTAPGMNFTFRASVTIEGQLPDKETLQRLNTLLDKIRKGWQLNL